MQQQQAALAALDAERDNLRAAWAWAARGECILDDETMYPSPD